jgi:hypothetical protein
MDIDDRIQEAMQKTELIRAPKRRLATFGSTTMEYYVVTELTEQMSAVRDGQVLAERPRIVTPYYLLHVEGFSEGARRFLGMMAQQNPHEAGIFYTYKNEPHSMNVVSEPLGVVVGNLSARLESEDRPLSAIMRGVEDVWDLAVMMFIYDLTRRAAGGNYADFQRHGLLNMDESGLPAAARQQIELLFAVAREDRSRASELVTELNRWGVYQEYEDRFLALFKR